MPSTIDRPDIIERPGMLPPPSPLGLPGWDEWEDVRNGADISGPWIVILYNDDWHTFDEVIDILCRATGCTEDRAMEIAIEVDSKGRAICYDGSREECERVAAIIATIRLQVETDKA
jgi:ATP-dependent Clp protease adapter protein ClpS